MRWNVVLQLLSFELPDWFTYIKTLHGRVMSFFQRGIRQIS